MFARLLTKTTTRPHNFYPQQTRLFSSNKRVPPKRPTRLSPAEARAKRKGDGSSGRIGKGMGNRADSAGSQGSSSGGSIPRGLIAVGALASMGGFWYSSMDEKGNVTGLLKTISDSIDTLADSAFGDEKKPMHEKLLPPFHEYQLDPMGNGPPTLVLAMEDTLVHTTWDRRNGYRVAKRPGVDEFLEFLVPYYEIVIVTELPFGIGAEMIYNLDRGRNVHHHMLCREALCRTGRKKWVKDLSYLNRDLSQVIVVDSNPNALERNPENFCQVVPYTNPVEQGNDTELKDLKAFLYTLATQRNPDFREVLKRYAGGNVAKQYKEKIKAHQEKLKNRVSLMKR
jgi:hypothetical protein